MAEFTDKEMESEIGMMLRVGVSISAAVVLLAGVWYLSGNHALADYSHFHAGSAGFRTLGGVFRGVARLDAASLIQFGILLLIATPVARVVLGVVGFARQRDRLYVGVSALVLVILIYSLTSGAR